MRPVLFQSLKSIPELKDLPADEQKRAWLTGARYALNRWPFLVAVVAMLAGYSALDVYVVERLVTNRWWRLCVFLLFFSAWYWITLHLIIHYARPYWRQLSNASR